jgi:hypothetical protein
MAGRQYSHLRLYREYTFNTHQDQVEEVYCYSNFNNDIRTCKTSICLSLLKTKHLQSHSFPQTLAKWDVRAPGLSFFLWYHLTNAPKTPWQMKLAVKR